MPRTPIVLRPGPSCQWRTEVRQATRAFLGVLREAGADVATGRLAVIRATRDAIGDTPTAELAGVIVVDHPIDGGSPTRVIGVAAAFRVILDLNRLARSDAIVAESIMAEVIAEIDGPHLADVN